MLTQKLATNIKVIKMPKKRYYLPVLLVYIITSMVMVTAFCALFYHHKQNELFEQNIFKLRDQAKFILHFTRSNDDNISQISGFKDYEVFVKKADKILQKDFEIKVDFLDNDIHRHSYFFKDGKYVYYSLWRDDTIAILRSDKLTKDLESILFTLLFIGAICFVLICAVSYFIVKMSYKPLLAHIKGLNSFITDTTHEINTPLSVILMSVEMFEKNPSKYLNNIKLASKTLSLLFGDLSANLKVMPLSMENVEASELVKQRVSFFELLANKKNLNFKLDLEDFSIKTDVFRFTKIIDNLISNAIKYSFAGEVIFIKLSKTCFEVSQKGVVIPPEKIGKIYDKYARFDSTNGGFGIGLSLVKSYCDELKYKISCSSSEEQTKFIVKFGPIL